MQEEKKVSQSINLEKEHLTKREIEEEEEENMLKK